MIEEIQIELQTARERLNEIAVALNEADQELSDDRRAYSRKKIGDAELTQSQARVISLGGVADDLRAEIQQLEADLASAVESERRANIIEGLKARAAAANQTANEIADTWTNACAALEGAALKLQIDMSTHAGHRLAFLNDCSRLGEPARDVVRELANGGCEVAGLCDAAGTYSYEFDCANGMPPQVSNTVFPLVSTAVENARIAAYRRELNETNQARNNV